MSASLDSNVALVTTTAMSNYLGIAAGSVEEEQVDLAINAASTLAAEMTGRGIDENGVSRFLSTSRTEYLDGDGTHTLHLGAYPITAVTTIYVDPEREYGSDTLLDSDSYVYYSTAGTVKADGAYFTSGLKSVKITYTGGYTTVPYDLQSAIKELVMFLYKRNTDKRVGVSNVSIGDKSISYEKDIPEAVKRTFKRYRDWKTAVG